MTTAAPVTYNREAISSALKSSIWSIQFRKVNGEVRHLRGTLHPSLLPAIPVVEGDAPAKAKKEPSPDVVNVYDLDEGAWRSFKIENLIHMSLLIPTPDPVL